MNPRPSTVSIVLPVYNVAPWLDECVLSLRAQTYRDIEIIVINDGSTDSSLSVARGHARRDARIMLIDQENRGLGGARNVGIEHASGAYLVFVDSDDFVADTFIETLVSMQRESGADVVSCRYAKVSDHSQFISYQGLGSLRETSSFNLTEYEKVLGMYSSSVVWGRLFKAREIAQSEVRFPDYMPHEDLFYTYKILKDGVHAEVSRPLYFWRQRAGSLGTSVSPTHLDVPWLLRDDTTAFLNVRSAGRREHALAARRNLAFLNLIWSRTVEQEKRLLPRLLSDVELNREAIYGDFRKVRCEFAELDGFNAGVLRALEWRLARTFA